MDVDFLSSALCYAHPGCFAKSARRAIEPTKGELMRRLIRFISIALAVLLGLVVVAAIAIYGVSEARLRTIHQVEVAPPAIPSDTASIERGRHLAMAVTMCAACHSASLEKPNLAGNIFLDIPPALRPSYETRLIESIEYNECRKTRCSWRET
jgi:hypothetical protein